MDATALLALATAAFLATHFVTSTPLRPTLVRAMGEWPYRGAYSAVALVTLVWMAWAYAGAPREMLWVGIREVAWVLMPLAFILVACGYWRNPTMVGADKLLRSADPARGIIRITRHPIMWGVMLWALAHIAARGDLKSVVFFGGFLLLALVGTLSMDRRKRADPDFVRFAAVTSHLPFAAIAQGRNRIVWREIGWLRPALGLAAFFVFFFLHPWLFGVAAAAEITRARLADPTTRYAHRALGDDIESGALEAELAGGRRLRYVLAEDSVFEDLEARVVDLDGDGCHEILVVRSRAAAGASLMALGVRGGRLVPIAETPAIGTPMRWLNPLGAADVDGDGRPEVLLVLTPHIGGTLVVYGYEKERFVEKWRLPGFSNHVYGSEEQGLHAFVDLDGDGVLDVIVPSADRRTLRAWSFARGTPRELRRMALPAPAAGNFRLEGGGLWVPLSDGRRHRVPLER